MTSPTVRAKFFVKAIKHFHDGDPSRASNQQGGEVEMAPVYGYLGGNKEQDPNAQWSKYTPSGELKMTVTSEGALEKFELGKAYYLDFTPADE